MDNLHPRILYEWNNREQKSFVYHDSWEMGRQANIQPQILPEWNMTVLARRGLVTP